MRAALASPRYRVVSGYVSSSTIYHMASRKLKFRGTCNAVKLQPKLRYMYMAGDQTDRLRKPVYHMGAPMPPTRQLIVPNKYNQDRVSQAREYSNCNCPAVLLLSIAKRPFSNVPFSDSTFA
jgi:hypothetical protein